MATTDTTKIKNRNTKGKKAQESYKQPNATPLDVKRTVEQMKQAAKQVTDKLPPKKGESRRVQVKSTQPDPTIKEKPALDRSVAQQAYDKLRDDMIEQHVKVTQLQIFHVSGPKGQLYVYLREGKWLVGPSMKAEPIAGSVHQAKAMKWAMDQLV